MSSSYGKNIRINIFGQSHSKAVGVNIEGIPAGEKIDMEELLSFLKRRAPGKNEFDTLRREEDVPIFLSGIVNGVSCGNPITAIIYNNDAKLDDYNSFREIPRPGHADYTAYIKYKGFQDMSGGGHFSGRLTAPLCIAGGICLQLLKRKKIEIISRIASIGNIFDDGELKTSTADKDFPVVSENAGRKMREEIKKAKESGDSIGGIIECVIKGIPAGIGDPIFDGIENKIAAIIFGIPAVKGIEFGRGFESAYMRGSECNDPFIIECGEILTKTNNCGGILGGITNGMPVVFRTAFKPTPSISIKQESVNLKEMKNTELEIGGRHDPCVVVRAIPAVEAASAIAVYDAIMEQNLYAR